MLVAAIKGLFLIGVLSWYSAAIFAMINNYFRNEFKEYMQKNPIVPVEVNVAKNFKSIEIEIASSVIESSSSPPPQQLQSLSSIPSSVISEQDAPIDECNTIKAANGFELNACLANGNFSQYKMIMKNLFQCNANDSND